MNNLESCVLNTKEWNKMNKTTKTELGVIQKVTIESMKFLYLEVPNDIENQKKHGQNLKITFLL